MKGDKRKEIECFYGEPLMIFEMKFENLPSEKSKRKILLNSISIRSGNKERLTSFLTFLEIHLKCIYKTWNIYSKGIKILQTDPQKMSSKLGNTGPLITLLLVVAMKRINYSSKERT